MSRQRKPIAASKMMFAGDREGTGWMATAITDLRRELAPGDEFSLGTTLPESLGDNAATQETRLRELTRRGVLQMRSVFDHQGKWVGYRWMLKEI